MTLDFLTNYELGWKTTFGPVRWNGAIYHQVWKKFQFSFLGENSLTVGFRTVGTPGSTSIETDVSYVRGGLTLNAAAAYTDAKTKDNMCNIAIDDAADCDTFYPDPTPEDPDAGDQDFIVTPDGSSPARHAKVQDVGNCALRLARGSWPGPCPSRTYPPKLRQLSTFG